MFVLNNNLYQGLFSISYNKNTIIKKNKSGKNIMLEIIYRIQHPLNVESSLYTSFKFYQVRTHVLILSL